jgi:membrane-bound inhibitor of C-type lysozyme
MSRCATSLSILALALLSACSDSEPPASNSTTENDAATDGMTSRTDPAPAIPSTARDDATPDTRSREYVYRCSSGTEFLVSYGDQTADIHLDGSYYELRQQPSEAGRRYTDESVELLVQDDRVVLMLGDNTHACEAIEVHDQEVRIEQLPSPNDPALR